MSTVFSQRHEILSHLLRSGLIAKGTASQSWFHKNIADIDYAILRFHDGLGTKSFWLAAVWLERRARLSPRYRLSARRHRRVFNGRASAATYSLVALPPTTITSSATSPSKTITPISNARLQGKSRWSQGRNDHGGAELLSEHITPSG